MITRGSENNISSDPAIDIKGDYIPRQKLNPGNNSSPKKRQEFVISNEVRNLAGPQ